MKALPKETPLTHVRLPVPKNRQKSIFSSVSALLFGVFLTWLYYPGLDSFFANDDWVILYHNSTIPPGEWWRYFSPRTIWFYRPLQSMQFGLTWYVAGLNHGAFNVQLLAMHLVVCALSWCLLWKLFGSGVAWLATFLFSISWIYVDILLWKANFNTLHHAIVTVAASLTFVMYLQSNRRRWYWVTFGIAVVNWFTKESGVGLPLVLGVIWLTNKLQVQWENVGRPVPLTAAIQQHLRQGFSDLWLFAAVSIVYVVLHKMLVVNVETNYPPGYNFVGPVTAVAQWMHGTNHSIFGFLHDPVFLSNFPQAHAALIRALEHGYFLPPALLGLAWWLRLPAAVFAVLFTLVTQFPHFALANYHASRYYYLPALGGAVCVAAPIWWAMRAAALTRTAEPRGHQRQRVIGYMFFIIMIWISIVNVVMFQKLIQNDRMQSEYFQKAYRLLQQTAPGLPAGSVIVLRNMPPAFSNSGLGNDEMLRFAASRSDLMAVAEEQKLTEKEFDRYKAASHRYLLDVSATNPTLVKF